MHEDHFVRNVIVSIIAMVVVVVAFFALLFGLLAAFKAFGRSQARANANNEVHIARIYIQKAHEEALITYAQIQATQAAARKRVVEANGLANAQRIIQGTLTPLYIQHEAIQAQEAIASSGRNNTVIYVPAGTNGTPIITQNAKP